MNNYVRENKVREVNVREQQSPEKFRSISVRVFVQLPNLRLANNCLKMTVHNEIGGSESKAAFLDT